MELGLDLLLGTSKQKDMGEKMLNDFGNTLESRIYCAAPAVTKNPTCPLIKLCCFVFEPAPILLDSSVSISAVY